MSQGDRWFVMLGNEEFGRDYDRAHWSVMSPDGSKFAYVAEKDGMEFVVCGSRRCDSFDQIVGPVISPDGKKIAFGARKDHELWWKVMDVK